MALKLGVVNVASSGFRLAFRPNAVEVPSAISHALRIVAVRMVEAGRGLVVAIGCGLGHDALRAPVSGAIGAAAFVHVPNAALPGSARTVASVIAARRVSVIHPN